MEEPGAVPGQVFGWQLGPHRVSEMPNKSLLHLCPPLPWAMEALPEGGWGALGKHLGAPAVRWAVPCCPVADCAGARPTRQSHTPFPSARTLFSQSRPSTQ